MRQKKRRAIWTIFVCVLAYAAFTILWRSTFSLQPLTAALRAETEVVTGADSDRRGTMLVMSGGGYRAMLFHLGALWRLNETGMLPQLDDVVGVSGGAIVAGALGIKWHRLQFNSAGVATNFDSAVVSPILELSRHTVDTRSVILGAVTPPTAAAHLVQLYGLYLTGKAKLHQLPDRPRFVLYATNLQNKQPWRFSKQRVGDWETTASSLNVPVAVAIAASSAFPPFLSPLELEMPGRTTTIMLTDGGVYDNLAMHTAERVQKMGRKQNLLISDASARVITVPTIGRDWFSQLTRAIDIIYDQPASLRKRNFIEGLLEGRAVGTYWSMKLHLNDYPVRSSLYFSEIAQESAAAMPTRLAALTDCEAQLLVNWGYLMSDASIRSYVNPQARAPDKLPYPDSTGPCHISSHRLTRGLSRAAAPIANLPH